MTTIFQATFLRETAWICGGYAREKREKLGAVTDTQENGGKIGGCEGCATLWRENNMASKNWELQRVRHIVEGNH